MHRVSAILIVISCACCEALANEDSEVGEARGKKKYALLIHFAWVLATKLFVLKLVYGGIFFALVTKAWHFIIWFTHYLKSKKHHHHHEHVEYVDHQPYFEDHGWAGQQYGGPAGPGANYPYRKQYDADGSYSVKSG
ncbi:uncharacterized protein LOC119692426 isoform X1 [Plutella xylostella]|uniref:uncharacterized protein LOC119692426 isoform X1 n=1 Tax=Plutella xylostella TaxID=51655 RepID=UPI0018D04B16|nr:uncharacterized protein LOC119692426 isoform X1 [Plutella xylostella]